ncbi:phosphoenolpyruvate--protein phosphotransferase [Erysipelothrix inopinata]|uniref:Phosphoenolpyruvate-protein phosphotransferase n=1 Tax=Erysipelothrix inopinata TaxID=225084 RepID=A0A7G9RZ05_9FIRM|nr:phosphoenolpyruvate--protein phosphotransferase [Erysipelothrix inopinata]QNN60830.1 phosphoenolpyruvate--protein phosphotransferase [Erysipelothrix inopinata]
MIKGIAASAGVSVSKVFKLQHPVLNIEKRDADSETEVKKLQDAVVKTQNDITAIKEQAVGRLAEEDLAIFDAHLMVTQDPEFVGQIEEMIKNDNVNADFAADQVGNMFIGMFESMDDPYFRERAADIKDVAYRLKCHILGLNIPDLTRINEEVVIVAEDLTPSDTAQLDRRFVKGFATEIGGRTSHSAIMARSLEIPAIVGAGSILDQCEHGDEIVLDALEGVIIFKPTEEQKTEYAAKAEAFAEHRRSLLELKDAETITKDGHKVELAGNIGTPKDVEGVNNNGGEAVGLYRTEFLYMDASELPNEEDQFEAYKSVLENMAPGRVVVRTLDIGGDKELSYLKFPHEMNPFLGYRAIRLCLDRKDIFRVQIRALLRASVYGKLSIMFPMIATIQEFRDAKAVVEEEKKNLSKEGVAFSDDIELGMMVEIPAAAILADQFAKEADFFSIGTNDLIQYSMAADRMNEKVSYLYQPYNPSILRLVKMTIAGAHKEGKWCGMCGEMAGDERAIPLLLGLGLDEFSMSASSILEARRIIRDLSFAEMQALTEQALNCSTTEEVLTLLDNAIK